MKTSNIFATAIASTFLASLSISSTLPAHALSFSINSASAGAFATTDSALNVTGAASSPVLSVEIAGSTGDLEGLSIYLQDPTGKILLLATNLGSGTFSPSVIFSDTSSLGNIDLNASPYNGNFLPFDSSADLNGVATISSFADFSPTSDGDWNLRLINFNNTNVAIGQTTLTFADNTPIPMEFHPAIGILALAGLKLQKKI